MQIAAHYPSAAELAADVDSQLGHGGLLVRGEVPRGLEQFATVRLEVSCGSTAIVVAAQVLQFFPGVGVAVAIDADGRAQIAALASGAEPEIDERAATEPFEPMYEDDPAPPEGGDRAKRTTGAAAPMLEKIQRALKGDRDARFQILRDTNRQLHMHVLRNPGLGIDEVAAVARMTAVSVEALKHIASKREWGHRPEIAIALVRNPTVPVPVAIELLAHVSEADLTQLAKDTRTREPVQRAARRLVLK